ncbi:MAG: hsp70 family protein [Desulfobacterales bacterium]|nr:hsp70 family protein [Desulfobacterales bacterium]
MSDKKFIIGIDLGTTNCAVSYVDLQVPQDKKKQIKIFNVPQLTGLGEISSIPTLPSFLYIPGEYDISKDAIQMPWISDTDNFAGVLARDHGTKVPSRLVSSAKSWLCHKNVDRNAKILPWGASDEVKKISPIEATSSYLKHIKNAWNKSKGDDEELFLENQIVIITVPASFDEVARDLTLLAAKNAGYQDITLLEEPLAAFYSWLIRHEHHWNEFVKTNDLILVCDVGGGTTDFTLITLTETDKSPRFERIAVGDHLILGGDNMDLSIARQMELRFSKKASSFTSDRWRSLCHQCRRSKENILNGFSQKEKITLMGHGSKLIAGTISTDLSKEELQKIILEGFFPITDKTPKSKKDIKKGITEFGLPYEKEAAITLHIGWFLEQHREDVKNFLNKSPAPDLVLFNGGALKTDILQERIISSISNWFKDENAKIPNILENPEPDLAVALGASYYGLVKTGLGVRVGCGSARAYYLGISKKGDDETEKKDSICIVERGLEEGSTIELKNKKFEVIANQPVSFDMYSSSFRFGDKSGDIIPVDDSLSPLPPIQTVIKFGKKDAKTNIPVLIMAEFSEVGTLGVWCKSLISDHRWKLQFQLRDMGDILSIANVDESQTFEQTIIDNVIANIREGFSDKNDTTILENLNKTITSIVESPREKWPLRFIRTISDELINLIEFRKVSPMHESRWLNLLGFCQRPGIGDGLDEHRIKNIWKLYKQGPFFTNNQQTRSEWWIMWRRIAAGLKAGQQKQFLQDITPYIFSKRGPKISPQENLEIWMTMANMEKLLVKDKIKLGNALLATINPKKFKNQQLWCLSRIGARELLYGSVDRVIPPNEVSKWIDTLLSQNFPNPKPIASVICQMGRKTGDRVRDIATSNVDKILKWMEQEKIGLSFIKLIKEVVPLEKQEENSIFGETLPIGLILHGNVLDNEDGE